MINRVLSERSREQSVSIATQSSRSLGVPLTFFLAGWLSFNWCVTILRITRFYVAVPVFDYWRVIEDYPQYRFLHFAVFWRPHNEHRILFPELVFAFDQCFLRGRQILPLALSFCLYAATWFLMAFVAFRDNGVSFRSRLNASLTSGIVLGWPVCTFVLATTFLLQWSLLLFAVTAALVLVTDQIHRPIGVAQVAGAIICATVATFTAANGLALWLILIGLALYLRIARNLVMLMIVSAVCNLALFLFHYPAPHSDALRLLGHPLGTLGFVISYVSMPFGVIRSPIIGLVIGGLGLVLWVGLLAHSFRLSDLKTALMPFGYLSFLLLSAIITALGRFDITKPGFQGSKEARYILVSLIGWAWLFQSGFLHLAKQTAKTRWRRPLVIGLFSVFLIFMQIRLERWIRTQADFVANEQWASLGLENGLTDDALATAIFPSAGFVDHFLPVLKANHLSIFANDEVGWLGRNADLLLQSRRIASGEISQIWRIGSGLAVIVNTADVAVEPGDILLFINQSHSIVGIGKRLPAGLPKRLATRGSLKHAWAGFVNPGYGPVSSFTILAFDRRNATTVQIGHSVAAPRRER